MLLVRQRVQLAINLHDGGQRESETTLRTLQHTSNGVELVFREQRFGQHIGGELNGYLADILAHAVALFPNVLQVGAGDEYQVVVAYGLAMVANRAPYTCCVADEVQFIFRMAVNGEVERRLVAIGQIKAVAL